MGGDRQQIELEEDYMIDVIIDTLIDAVKLIPFLFITYLIMEFLESRTGDKTQNVVRKAGWLGPLWGGVLGMFPQCGFSAAASNFYAGRVISVGTLLAVYLSTSDEMLPIMISEQAPVATMIKIMLTKVVIAVAAGFIVDAAMHMSKSRTTGQADSDEGLEIERLCRKEKCHCDDEGGSIWKSALKHTVNILIFVIIITFVLNCAFHYVGSERLESLFSNVPVVGEMIAALIGLIPNCGASVLLTQLYLRGVMSASQLIAGLLVGAGVGLLVLFRVNPDTKENVRITALLYVIGVLGGVVVSALGMVF
mgnify:CR=1 FL=1